MNWLISLLQHPFFLVGCGGALGSIVRFAISRWSQSLLSASFPVATLSINVLGGFLLGCLASSIAQRDQSAYLFLGVGMCGGFTTFSAFSLETLEQLQRGETARAFFYIIASVILGIAATWIGILTCK